MWLRYMYAERTPPPVQQLHTRTHIHRTSSDNTLRFSDRPDVWLVADAAVAPASSRAAAKDVAGAWDDGEVTGRSGNGGGGGGVMEVVVCTVAEADDPATVVGLLSSGVGELDSNSDAIDPVALQSQRNACRTRVRRRAHTHAHTHTHTHTYG